MTMRLLVILAGIMLAKGAASQLYFGTSLGSLQEKAHDVGGNVYIVDERTLYIRNFNYDGEAPDAYFWVGTSGSSPSTRGTALPDERGSRMPLGRYITQHITISIVPGTKSADNIEITTATIKWLSVWCRNFTVNMGHIMFPDSPVIPAPVMVGSLSSLAHKVSSGEVTVLNTQQIHIKNLMYDGLGPDAYFWVGSTASPDTSGTIIPDENGSKEILKAYNGKDVTLTLDDTMSWRNLTWLSLWCKRAVQDFGNVMFQDGQLDNIPPFISDKQANLGNCEQLHDHLTVSWEIEDDVITFELSAALEDEFGVGYVAFGLSGSDSSSSMAGADVAVGSVKEGEPSIRDYYINAYSLCSGSKGVCRDTHQNGTDDLTLWFTQWNMGITTFRYSRKLDTDSETDRAVNADTEQYIVWAMGQLDQSDEVTKHNLRLRGDKQIHFGRSAVDTCKGVTPREKETYEPWEAEMLWGDELGSDKVITARIGPAGGQRGYSAITKLVSWGIAWYLNEKLIPTLVLRRGETFTFKVEGGMNPDQSAMYHPLYITNSEMGGYGSKEEAERKAENLYAGVRDDGYPDPEAVGRYCEYKVASETKAPEKYDTFDAYFATLELDCEDGKTGTLKWTPTATTPDLLYYQCYTHRHLGWKIIVVDDYDEYRKTMTDGGAAFITATPLWIILVAVTNKLLF